MCLCVCVCVCVRVRVCRECVSACMQMTNFEVPRFINSWMSWRSYVVCRFTSTRVFYTGRLSLSLSSLSLSLSPLPSFSLSLTSLSLSLSLSLPPSLSLSLSLSSSLSLSLSLSLLSLSLSLSLALRSCVFLICCSPSFFHILIKTTDSVQDDFPIGLSCLFLLLFFCLL